MEVNDKWWIFLLCTKEPTSDSVRSVVTAIGEDFTVFNALVDIHLTGFTYKIINNFEQMLILFFQYSRSSVDAGLVASTTTGGESLAAILPKKAAALGDNFSMVIS